MPLFLLIDHYSVEPIISTGVVVGVRVALRLGVLVMMGLTVGVILGVTLTVIV